MKRRDQIVGKFRVSLEKENTSEKPLVVISKEPPAQLISKDKCGGNLLANIRPVNFHKKKNQPVKFNFNGMPEK
jgi:hypothetical protein